MGDLHTLLATHLSSFEFQIEGSKLRASWGLGNVALGFERDFKVCTRPRRCLVWNYVCKLYPKYHLTLINLYCVSIKSQWRCLNSWTNVIESELVGAIPSPHLLHTEESPVLSNRDPLKLDISIGEKFWYWMILNL